jgi:transcriptional regulator with XRE-family HTH domain
MVVRKSRVAAYSRSEDFAPAAMDVHVGARIRMRRLRVGMTADRLSQEIFVTKQALKRFEAGEVRIAVGRLADIAIALNIAPSWFLEEFPVPGTPTNGDPMLKMMAQSRDGMAMLGAYLSLGPSQRKAMLSICEDLAASVPTAPATVED